jgi:hypothetical protein
MAMTSYLRKALGDESIGKVAFAMPSAVYLALFTASPGDSGSLTNEVTGGSYARIEITSKMSVFNSGTGIAISTADITFASPTADWGTVSYVGVADASTSGNLLFYEALPTARAVVNGGRRVSFLSGQFQLRLV